MIINMTGGGGGTSLNFDVKAYATEELLLAATPKENTIGIITTTAINGWVFSATEPTEPVEGMVWITVGTSSTVEFNTLKKNAIQVYPLSAKQYVDGAWVDVPAYSYQGGEWVSWNTDLVIFKAGTGAVQEYTTKKGDSGAISVTASKIAIDYTGNGNGSDVVYYTKSKFNTSGYSTLRLTGNFSEIDTDNDYTGFGLMSSVPITDNFSAQSWVASKGIPQAASKTYDLDISSCNDSYYIVFAAAVCVGAITDFRLLK